MQPFPRLARVGWAIAGAQVLVGAVLAFVPNAEGWFGGILFAAFYAIPTSLVAMSLRSRRRWLRTACGWGALLLAVFLIAIPIGNWPGYSSYEAAFAVAVTVPPAVFDLAVFRVAVVRQAGRPRQVTA